MIEEEMYGLMIKSFLNNPLFDRSKRMAMSKVNTNTENCSRQLIENIPEPKIAKRGIKNLDFESLEDERRFHERANKSQNQDLKELKPEEVQNIIANNAGVSMIDNRAVITSRTDKAIKRENNKRN